MSHSQAQPTQVTTRKPDQVVVIEIRGRLTLSSGACGRLRTEVGRALEAGERRIVIDLESVTKIDSSGFGELVAAHNQVSAHNGALVLANPTARFLRYLSVHMMDQSIGGGPYDSVQSAIDGLRKLSLPAPQDET